MEKIKEIVEMMKLIGTRFGDKVKLLNQIYEDYPNIQRSTPLNVYTQKGLVFTLEERSDEDVLRIYEVE